MDSGPIAGLAVVLDVFEVFAERIADCISVSVLTLAVCLPIAVR